MVTLHPREEIRVVLKENAERYRSINGARFKELIERLKASDCRGELTLLPVHP